MKLQRNQPPLLSFILNTIHVDADDDEADLYIVL